MTDRFQETLNRLRAFFRKQPLDNELDSEMTAHLDFAIEENLQRGLSPEEARREALVRFGGLMQAREQHRESRGLPALDVFGQDLRYALRTMRRDRAFTLIAVLILALGVGANVAVFSVVNTLLLRPLPLRDPQRLVWITPKDARSGLSGLTYSVDAYKELQQQNQSFADVTSFFAFFSGSDYKLTGRGEPVPVAGINVAGNFFQTLGVEPAKGRLFTPDDCLKNGRRAVLLGYGFWRRKFASNSGIVGQSIDLNGQSYTVIGVLPATFDFGAIFSPGTRVDVFVPAVLEDMQDWGNTMAIIGRLKPGVTLPQAQADADAVFPRLHFNLKHPEYGGGYSGRLTDLKDYVSGKLRRSLVVLWCAVGLILLIVCVNLSNLLLARGAARGKEFAMRSALGAGRGRLMRQLLTESLVLSSAAAILGLGLAVALTAYVARQGSLALPLLTSVRVDGTALLWTVLTAVSVAVLFGLVPALKLSAGNLQETLKDAGRGASGSRQHDGLRSALVVSEVALACMLLAGAGLLLRSFIKVMDVDLGFQPSRAAAIKVDYDDGNKAANRAAILQEVVGRVSALPGVEAAGVSDMLPLDRNRSWNLDAKGRHSRQDELPGAFVYVTTPGYFRAMGIRLLAGRDFNWQDGLDRNPVVIVSQTAARYLWSGQDAVGRMAVVNATDMRVIGVVPDVRESSVEGASGWDIYLSAGESSPAGAELVVRSKLPPEALASSVMRTLRSINPEQSAAEFRPIQQLVDRSVSPRRFFVMLVSTFAALGLTLAALGIYGVISYEVTRRTPEIGIRMALGATTTNVQLDVMAGTLWLTFIGMALGTAASFAVSKTISSLLFGTQPNDPATFAGMILLLGVIALVAGYIPARRASRIDPMIALRAE